MLTLLLFAYCIGSHSQCLGWTTTIYRCESRNVRFTQQLIQNKEAQKLLYECVLESTLIIFVTITYYHNNSAYINIKDGDVQNCTVFDFEITKVVISSCEALFYKSNLKGRVHPTMKIMSLITESPTCRSKSVRPLFVLGTLIHIFFNPRAF